MWRSGGLALVVIHALLIRQLVSEMGIPLHLLLRLRGCEARHITLAFLALVAVRDA